MRLVEVSIENFRNIEQSIIRLDSGDNFFLGKNAQGKSNMLEAIALMTSTQSFRTRKQEPLIRYGTSSARLLYRFEDEFKTPIELMLSIEPNKKTITLDNQVIPRIKDFIGLFPSVVLSSRDINLVRGSSDNRRRFIDMLLSVAHTDYLHALLIYNQAKKSRNALLKKKAPDNTCIPFEKIMAEKALFLGQSRIESLEIFELLFAEKYATFVKAPEQVRLAYKPNIEAQSLEEVLKIFEDSRERDKQIGFSQRGPHKDNFDFYLGDHKIVDSASEGQARSIAVALRIAQMHYFYELKGVLPILLLDDMLGELDIDRRTLFWESLEFPCQRIATGTTLPTELQGSCQLYLVENGNFSLENSV